MALWFKPKSHGVALAYNRDDLTKEAMKNWETLYEVKDEHGWKILMRQLDIAYNQEILNLSKIDLGPKGVERLAIHKGVVNFIHTFRVTLDEQFRLIQQQKSRQGRDASHGKKVLGKPSSKRTRPPLS
jgi:hypothetical protein